MHHTPGRLRVKIDKAIVKDVKDISLSDIQNLPKQIQGLNEIKVNKVMATATILYDASIFPPYLWDDLIEANNVDNVLEMLNDLQNRIKENI